jgi:hypothetical protein
MTYKLSIVTKVMKVIKDFILFTMNCPKSGTKLAGCYAVVFFLHFVKNQNILYIILIRTSPSL